MPATPKPRSKNGPHLIASWQLLSTKFSYQAFQRYGCGILARLRRVLIRHRDGFNWKEAAASLQISGAATNDSFWSEMKRTASNRMPRQSGPAAIPDPAPDNSQIPNSKTSQ